MQRQRHVTDFVQQQSAAVGTVKQPGAVTVGTGKGAFAVTEQLAFQQGLREGRAVLHDKGPVTARAAVMNRPGDDFFAGAGFAHQQHGVGAVQHFVDQVVRLAHDPAFADQPTRAAGQV